MFDTSRIAALIDVERLQDSCITIVGNGGGANLARNLVRCGTAAVKLVDFDRVEFVNVSRQEHMHDTVGMLKVEALAAELRRINPAVKIECFPRDFCSFGDEEIDDAFADTDVFVFAVDNLAANARGNEVTLRLGKPAVWSGVYPLGRGGEVVFWHGDFPALPCYRCLCAARYRAQERGGISPDPAASADVLAVQFVDSITGMIALGLLTRGAKNFYGRLIDQLGDHNFIHVKVHDWTWNGRDIVREQLRVPADCDTFFAWNTAARRDPDGGEPPCPDCVRFLGRGPRPAIERIPCITF